MATAFDTLLHVPAQPQRQAISGYQHRRGMLASLAGIAAAGATAVAAQAPDPVLELAARAQALQAQADALEAVGDDEGANHVWGLRWLADEQVLATAPTSLAGLVQQLRIVGDRLHGGTRGPEDGDDVHRLAGFAEALNGRAVA